MTTHALLIRFGQNPLIVQFLSFSKSLKSKNKLNMNYSANKTYIIPIVESGVKHHKPQTTTTTPVQCIYNELDLFEHGIYQKKSKEIFNFNTLSF